MIDRPDHLTDVLASQVGAWLLADGASSAGAFTCKLHGPPPSGNSNVTLPFTIQANDIAPLDLVLRMQHPDNQIFLDADVLREYELLAALALDPAVPAPLPRWRQPDPDVLGHPFFVMDHVAGTVPAGMPSIHATGWLVDQAPTVVGHAVDSTLGALAAVHRFDWRTHCPWLGDAAHGTTMAARLDHLRAWYRWVTKGREFPTTDAGFDFLEATVADLEPFEPVLLWGDPRLGNTMLDQAGNAAALLDWELASIGPAAFDLAWWLMFEEFSTDAHGIDRLPGFPDRAETIVTYGAAAGGTPSDIAWYEMLAAWVVTVTVIRMTDIGVAKGQLAPTTRMAHGNLTAQMLARKLDLPIPVLDPDYARRRNL